MKGIALHRALGISVNSGCVAPQKAGSGVEWATRYRINAG